MGSARELLVSATCFWVTSEPGPCDCHMVVLWSMFVGLGASNTPYSLLKVYSNCRIVKRDVGYRYRRPRCSKVTATGSALPTPKHAWNPYESGCFVDFGNLYRVPEKYGECIHLVSDWGTAKKKPWGQSSTEEFFFPGYTLACLEPTYWQHFASSLLCAQALFAEEIDLYGLYGISLGGLMGLSARETF